MAFIPRVASCDACGILKGKTNHWYCIRTYSDRIEVEPYRDEARGVQHACGRGCMSKLIERALDAMAATGNASPEPEPIVFPLLEKATLEEIRVDTEGD